MDTREMTPGDRRELRSLVKKQFDILRKDVKRRESEMEAEIEAELLRRYRAEDEATAQAVDAVNCAREDYLRAVMQIADALHDQYPDIETHVSQNYGGVQFSSGNTNRVQLRRALMASIPQKIADASTQLDQDELTLLRDLTIGALDSEQAQQFLDRIPTVGQLVPQARLAELTDGKH